jgi:hypothetical protein
MGRMGINIGIIFFALLRNNGTIRPSENIISGQAWEDLFI